MGLYRFANGTADVTTDATGNTVGGIHLSVWTSPERTQQVTDLYDWAGDPLPGYVTSVDSVDPQARGRVSFKASDAYSALFLWDGNVDHDPWGVLAIEATTLIKTAIDKSDAAFEQGNEQAEQITDINGQLDRMLTPDLDVTKRPATFAAELIPVTQQRAGQSYRKDHATGDWFMAQVDYAGPGSPDSNVISRCAPDGSFLDSMHLTHGGHGTSFGVENVDDGAGNLVPYIWWAWEGAGAAAPANDLVRFPYVAGATITRDDASIVAFDDFGNASTPQVDVCEQLDLMCIRGISALPGLDVYELRRLSDVKADMDDLVATVQAPNSTVLQGFGFDDTHLYLSTGSSGSTDQEVVVYSWATGEQVGSVDITGIGVVAGELHEPESAQVYIDPASGIRTLFVGVCGGVGGGRRNYVYAFTPPGGPDYSAATVGRALSNAPVVGAGACRWVDNNVPSLRVLTRPGWYFIPAARVLGLGTDRPSTMNETYDWFLQVSGHGSTKNGFMQTLTMSGIGTNRKQYFRVVRDDGVSNWFEVGTTSVGYATT